MSDSPKTTGKIKPDFGTLCRYVEKLKKKLEQRSEEIKRIDSNVHVLMQLIEQKDAEIERLKSERRWIPVSERLPEVGKLVWCAYKSGEKYYFMQSRMNKDGQFRAEKHIKRVTHWMPLPTPPEDE